MATLTQDQPLSPPPPKAVNIIRPSSPRFHHYLKQRQSPALNHPYHSYQHSTLSKVSDDLQEPPSFGSASSTTSSSSSSSSPSTLSTLSSGSGYNTNGNRLPPPAILNTTSFGFGFFQSQQNSTASPTSWFKSPSPPSQQQKSTKPVPATIDTTIVTSPLSTPALSPTTPKPTATVKALPPSSGFMAPFSSRFFRVPQQHQPYSADIHLEDSSGDEDEHFESQDEDDYYDSIDGDTESEDLNDDDDDDDDDDVDMNDTMTDYDDESQDEEDDTLPIKIVARIKQGTIIMNGKGEFVNKGGDDDRSSYSSWLDEARASRKIADLEIEKTSLMALNSALESKVAQQSDRITKLEKQLQLHTNELPLSPVSDKDMDECTPCLETLASTEILTEDEIANDHVFQRLRSMLLGLIEHAEEAVRLKTKSTGRVLSLQYEHEDKRAITLDSPPAPPMKSLKKKTLRQRSLQSTTTATTTQQQKRPLRRSSDVTQDGRQRQHSSSTDLTRKRTSMERSLSHASSPATLATTSTANKNVSTPPRPASAPMLRSSPTTTKPRQSHLRKSQDLESPKWHY
ncbi:unnamed protein product [Absidia cylindrospora]